METTMQNAELPLGELCKRLQQKFEYARLVDGFSAQQQTFVAGGDYDGLVRLLGQKQAAVEQLQAASQATPPLLDQWKRNRDQLPQILRDQCERWLAATEKFLADIKQRDEQCTQEMQQRRDETQSQLAAISAAINTQDAYADPVESRHFDMNR
ncbi:hypothetical protein [Rubinisphaera sp. JC750]|uniref:hypothetical protein n=1 Tax=Rubinisphaera sp. JC750 TaxID=2898658 RepID=UPI001F3E9BAE|nr:hypothetical protein [Rubinisphaera sp. JC750]